MQTEMTKHMQRYCTCPAPVPLWSLGTWHRRTAFTEVKVTLIVVQCVVVWDCPRHVRVVVIVRWVGGLLHEGRWLSRGRAWSHHYLHLGLDGCSWVWHDDCWRWLFGVLVFGLWSRFGFSTEADSESDQNNHKSGSIGGNPHGSLQVSQTT